MLRNTFVNLSLSFSVALTAFGCSDDVSVTIDSSSRPRDVTTADRSRVDQNRDAAPPDLPGSDQLLPDHGVLDVPAPDLSKADQLTPDLPAPDVPAPDLSAPDVLVPDGPVPDLPAPDLPAPDLPAPDLLVPDQPVPDLLAPDQPVPDLPAPDLPVPDLFVPDQLLPDQPIPVGSSPLNPGLSCVDILKRGGSTGDGDYWVQPASAPAAFLVACEMTTDGGGWTRLIDSFTQSLDTTTSKQYLYAKNGHWYISPPTTLAWTWSAGQELTGSYSYYDGSSTQSYACNGSGEKPHFGVGCSNGPGGTWKTLPAYNSSAATGSCTICQDHPKVFTEAVCAPDVAVYVR